MDESDWAFGPEQIALLSHYVTRMHELNSDQRNVPSNLPTTFFFIVFIPVVVDTCWVSVPICNWNNPAPSAGVTRGGDLWSVRLAFFCSAADSDAALTTTMMMMMMAKRGTRSHSDSSTKTVAPRPQMNFDSGQMSFLCQL